MLPFYFYLELEGFAFVVCFLLHLNLKKKHSLLPDEKIFSYLIFANMAILFMDMISWCCDRQSFPFAGPLLIISNTVYYVISCGILFLWLLYVSLRLNKRDIPNFLKVLLLLPLIYELIMSVTAPINGLFFYVDTANVYHRGDWCWTQAVIGIAYLLFAAIIAFIHGIRTKDSQQKKESFILVIFTIFPLLCSLLQALFFGLPLIWIGTTVSFLIFFIQTQNSQISIDALTKLNNRGKFDAYLTQKINTLKKNETLHLVVIDIDKFKLINDNFGHVEGDEALIALANILIKVCANNNDFSARYGGDEFTLVCIRQSGESIAPLLDNIKALIKDFNMYGGKDFCINISYGLASSDEETVFTEDSLKRKADKHMYEMKALHHNSVIKSEYAN